MAQFRFRIQDKEGRIRTGRMAAAHRADAQTRIEQAGMKVLELTEILDPGAASDLRIQNANKSIYRAPRADPYEWKESLLDRLWSKTPSGRPAGVVFGVLCAVGIVWGLWGWYSGKSSKKTMAEPTPVPISVTIAGEVSMPGVPDFGDLDLVLDFPEIPYRVTRKWSELEHPSQGRFTWHTEFKSSKSPGNCTIRAVKPLHEEARAGPLRLSTGQASFTVDLNLKLASPKPKTGRTDPAASR